MRAGWNPVRRNKHIGTKAQGHGDDNELVIPNTFACWKLLTSYRLVKRVIGRKEQLFFVEPTRAGCFHPCTVDDIAAVLRHCDPDDLESFDFVVLRQPTVKQGILEPAWGRAIWHVEIGEYEGSAIVIEARDLKPYTWSTSLGPARVRELDRLRKDGHLINRNRRSYDVYPTAASVRSTVLYRTLLHELGHHVDYVRSTYEEWGGKTSLVKEDFAHRYAEVAQQRMRAEAHIPFAPIGDAEAFATEGMAWEWFFLAHAAECVES